jgi:hypothetical protein
MSSKQTEQTPLVRFLLRPAGTWLERLVGVAALLFGSAIFAASCLLLHAAFTKPAGVPIPIYFVTLAFTTLAALLLNAGVRLVFALPKKFGALFAPSVWFLVSGALLCFSAFIAYTITTTNIVGGAQALASGLLLALLSYGVGSHFRAKARTRSAA